MRTRLFLMASLVLTACVKTPEPAPAPTPAPPSEPCPYVYVYAPGNYIIDIAGGADVVLDPGASDFELFCSPGAARAAVNAAGSLILGFAAFIALHAAFAQLA